MQSLTKEKSLRDSACKVLGDAAFARIVNRRRSGWILLVSNHRDDISRKEDRVRERVEGSETTESPSDEKEDLEVRGAENRRLPQNRRDETLESNRIETNRNESNLPRPLAAT